MRKLERVVDDGAEAAAGVARSTVPRLGDRAHDDLRFIRDAMARSGRFTAVPGLGAIGVGVIGLVAAAVAGTRATPGMWLATWLVAAALAASLGGVAVRRKAQRQRTRVLAPPGRKALLGFLPPVVAGAALTAVLWRAGQGAALPGTWLLLYGAGVVASGMASVLAIPILGGAFMVLGVLAFIAPTVWGDVFLAAGFGGLHIGFGIWIARRHGG